MKSIVMKAAQSTIRNQGCDLVESIPLSTPYAINIDPANICNFKCKFCPSGYKKLITGSARKQGLMEFSLFEKIVEDMKQFDKKIKRINLWKDGEPFLNTKLADMVAYIKKSNVSKEVWTSTNGYLLEQDVVKNIISAGIDLIRVSIEAVSSEGYWELAGVNIDYEKLRERIAYLYENRKQCKIHVRILDCGLSEEEKVKFFSDFKNYSTSIEIEKAAKIWPVEDSYDFSLGRNENFDVYGRKQKMKHSCHFPFYLMAVNVDGRVSACCVDWAHKVIVGDVHKMSLKNIWLGDALFRLQKMQLQHKRHLHPFCKDCLNLHRFPANIDGFEETLLERIVSFRKTSGITS